MKRFFSICLAFAILALCVSPLFFPSDAKAEQPVVQASDLEAKDAGTNYDALPDGGAATDSAADAQAQGAETDAEATDPVAPEPESPLWQRVFAYLRENTAEAVMAFLAIVQIIVNITPSEKDNGWFLWLRKIFEFFFPNLRKGGGTHPPA
jgi:dihydropteroate synthase